MRSIVEVMESDLQCKEDARHKEIEEGRHLVSEAIKVLAAYLVESGWDPATLDFNLDRITCWKRMGGHSIRLLLSPKGYIERSGGRLSRPAIVVHLEGQRDPINERSFCTAIASLTDSTRWRKRKHTDGPKC